MKTTHLSYTQFLHDAEKSPKIINLANSEQRTANSEQRTANSEITSLSEVWITIIFAPSFDFVYDV